MTLISCRDVTVQFRHHQRLLLRDHLQQALGRRKGEWFYALRNVSVDVGEGEGIAIIGRNGAGKSTLLGVLAGLLEPASGQVFIRCGVSVLLELGSGFHYDLTGRENLHLNGAVLGYRREELDAASRDIIEFSELEAFIDEPLRTYSAGMVLRLAFSIAVHAKSNPVMMVDELLAVGDAAFQQKCRRRIAEMRAQGKTLIFVSHVPQSLAQFCDRAVWLEAGRKILDGPLDQVAREYAEFMADPNRTLAAAAP
jgi:ABC-type polysaccharide/polyol phosphate transport system ATPase subunit